MLYLMVSSSTGKGGCPQDPEEIARIVNDECLSLLGPSSGEVGAEEDLPPVIPPLGKRRRLTATTTADYGGL